MISAMSRTRSTSGSGQSRAWRNVPTESALTSRPPIEHRDRQVRLLAASAGVARSAVASVGRSRSRSPRPHDLAAPQPAEIPAQRLRVREAQRRDAGAPPRSAASMASSVSDSSKTVERSTSSVSTMRWRAASIASGNSSTGEVAESRGDVGGEALERLELALDGTGGVVRHGGATMTSLPQDAAADNNMSCAVLLTAYCEHRPNLAGHRRLGLRL